MYVYTCKNNSDSIRICVFSNVL
uniref:Uncharacterized protein n=1 Tax=Lepeophtheirus salmonis TaxID=72036 RepID=A0A0K2VB18_LEPSM